MITEIKFKLLCFVLLMGTVTYSLLQTAIAATTDISELGETLTPFGAERAGNADGSIPAYTKVDPSYKQGGTRPDPFSTDKPLFSITAQSVAQYADKLSDGVRAMFKRYPGTYRIDVYPTRRTVAAPHWVNDNTRKNATEAKLVGSSAGPIPQGAYGGIPFPVPKNGDEAMWMLNEAGSSVTQGLYCYY